MSNSAPYSPIQYQNQLEENQVLRLELARVRAELAQMAIDYYRLEKKNEFLKKELEEAKR